MKTNNKTINLLSITIIALSFLLSACGGDIPNEKTISASNISVSGDGGEYFKVNNGDYILKVVDDKVLIAVKFELIKKCPNENPKMGNISLIPLDKTGVAVPDLGLDFKPATVSDYDKINDFLKGDTANTVTISFKWSYFSAKDKQKRIMNETENFEITRTDISENSSKSTTKVSSSKSSNWDAVLMSYEEYIDQYIALLKKAQNGDMDAITEYATMMEKAIILSEKLENADNELTPEQMSKFLKLQTKLTNAALEMQ